MKHVLLKIALTLALTGCGGDDHAANRGDSAVDHATLTKFDLTSSSFQPNEAIPAQYSCDGADQSPALTWGEPPPGTKSFALVVDDPDAPSGTFRHWGAWDIPAGTRSLAAGQAVGKQAVNGAGKSGYMGPCPPPGHGVHHYHFKLYALDTDTLDVGDGAKVEEVEQAAQKHALGRAELVGTFERK